MAPFRRLRPHQLEALSDRDLLDHVVAAREAGEREAERDAVGYLAYAFEPAIRGWVRRRGVPDQDVDDVVMEVQRSLIKASFEAKILGEFGAFVRTVSHRRAADYWREVGRHPPSEALAEEHEGDDDVWGAGPSTPDETGLLGARQLVEIVLGRRNELHQKVLRLYGPEVAGFEGLTAEETCARIAADGSGDAMRPDNVAQIWRRFKVDFESELDG